MRLLRAVVTWGRCPQTPGIFRFAARMDPFEGAGCARPRPIPATESALGLRSRIALSSAQVLLEWTTSTSPCNNFLSNGDNPLNFLSHWKGSPQSLPPPQKVHTTREGPLAPSPNFQNSTGDTRLR